ncbi:MAG: hypothetical protein RLZZ499_2278 [Cyanobacteriota bacterium]
MNNLDATKLTIVDPEVDFEVIDFGPDGIGDEVFPTFNTVVLGLPGEGVFGPTGESAAIVEFDLSNLSIPVGEVVEQAVFEVQITTFDVSGLGVQANDNPEQLGVYGYVGNGIAEASDFQSGELLTVLDISSASAGDILTFDVTEFFQTVSEQDHSFAGLAVRAQDVGGLAIPESASVPRLSITTKPSPNSTSAPIFGTTEEDLIEVKGSDQLIFAGNSDDLVDAAYGSQGGNRIYAGSGNDTLILGSGDRLFGAEGGDNTISGGEGADQFWIASGEIPDVANTITDFASGTDILGIGGLAIGYNDLSITQDHTSTVIAVNCENLAILPGVDVADLSVDDFVFV